MRVPSRRDFLRLMAGSLPALAAPIAQGHLLFPTPQASSAGKTDLFELVPPATSGITWRM